MEVVLRSILPELLGGAISFEVYSFQGKPDLLGKLSQRLRGYRAWLPETYRIVVMVDRDDDDCKDLKDRLERVAADAGLVSRSSAQSGDWQLVNRIVVEELEAWFLGDIEALRTAFPQIPKTLGQRKQFRDPDAVPGGTRQALERVLQRSGYFKSGLRKIELARQVSPLLAPEKNRSRSFQVFCEAINELAEL